MSTTHDAPTIAAILRETEGRPPFPTRADRGAWERLRGGRVPAQIMAGAEGALAEPTPRTTATDYLAFSREGRREPYERPHVRRRERLILLTLAECLEGEGRFADAILNEGWAICEEATWVVPAHGWEWAHGLPDPAVPLIDLYSAITAFTLAEVDYLLGDLLHPALRAQIRHEVGARSTAPFLARDDWRWLGRGEKRINNWLPVCVGGGAMAALYLEGDTDRLAATLAKALDGMRRYLASFGRDGACAEGVGYWEKGFFFYAAFAQLLAARTAGRIDPLDDPQVRRVAAFPPAVELSPGRFVAFSDTGIDRRPQLALLHFLAQRFDLPALAALDHEGPERRDLTNRGPAEKLRDLFWYPDDFRPAHRPEGTRPSPATFFPDVQWLVARADPDDPDGLVLAAKAGCNDEPHNQNDVGSFMVHWRGESLIAELGAGRYTRDYFRPEHRYSFLPNASRGHSVPLPNGREQRTGTDARARDARHLTGEGEEGLEMDLAAAYPPDAGLDQLRRRITLRRSPAPGAVKLRDAARFRGAPGRLESALISFAEATTESPGQVVLTGTTGRLAIDYDPEAVEARIERIAGVDLRGGPTDVTRIALVAREPAHETEIAVRLTPQP